MSQISKLDSQIVPNTPESALGPKSWAARLGARPNQAPAPRLHLPPPSRKAPHPLAPWRALRAPWAAATSRPGRSGLPDRLKVSKYFKVPQIRQNRRKPAIEDEEEV